MRNLTPAARAYLIVLALAAAGLLAFLLPGAEVLRGRDLVLAFFLTALMLITNWWMSYFTTERGISLGFSAAFAALLLFDPGVAVAIALVGILGANLLDRHSFYFAMCDASDVVLATGLAGLVISADGNVGVGSLSNPTHLALIFGAAIVMYAVNTFDWAVVYVLNGEGTWLSELRGLSEGAFVLAFCLEIALGFLVAVLALLMPWALIFLSVPAFTAYVVVERQAKWRRRMQESLVRTEASLANAQRIANVGSWEWSPGQDLMMWSDETYRILGLEPQERLPTSEEYVNNAHPDDRARLQEALNETSTTGESFGLEYRVVRPDGEVRHVYLRGEAAQASGGKTNLAGTLLDITERKELEHRLAYQAHHDALTGLPNRVLFTDRLEIALARTRRQRGQVAILLLDLDHFKEVNDTMGHEAGDLLLQEVSSRLSGCLRPHDTVARLGGDEFVMLLDQADRDAAANVARRVIEAIRTPYSIHGREARVDASIGITLSNGDNNPDWLIRVADVAMYEAKHSGRGRYRFYVPRRNPHDFRMLLM